MAVTSSILHIGVKYGKQSWFQRTVRSPIKGHLEYRSGWKID
jgi:hypothetical protein